MIGHRVRLVTAPFEPGERCGSVTGTLHRLDAVGATLWRDDCMPEQQTHVFIPSRRIVEIVELGRDL